MATATKRTPAQTPRRQTVSACVQCRKPVTGTGTYCKGCGGLACGNCAVMHQRACGVRR